jgi:protein-S-isoprenylcysteine O-methyltransferase Ste14
MLILVIFILLSIPLVIISYQSILIPGSHGFNRFFGWEGTLWLSVSNIQYWFDDPFSIKQLISWVFLFYSLYLVIAGVILLKKKGKAQQSRADTSLFEFEKTTELVETGLYRYIRHPLYGSLIFLSWGIFLKHPSYFLLVVSMFATIMYYMTALKDEKECIAYFGEGYIDYMTRTKMFVPFIF